MQTFFHRCLTTLSLFSSFSTLICCALPALLVTLGLGAALAGLVTNVPQLIWISEHKTPLFLFSFIMLLLNGVLRYYSRFAACPTGQVIPCDTLYHISGIIYMISIVMFITGFCFAYVFPYFIT